MKFNKYGKPILILVFIICVFFVQTHSDLLFTTSIHIEYSDIVYATLDNKGNQLIIDESGQRLIKVNANGEIELIVKGGMKSGKGFYDAKRVLTDADNHIYVLNILKEEGGYRIRKEEIVEYSPDGKYLGIVCEIEHEEPVLVEDIVGLFTVDGNLTYMQNSVDSFDLYKKDNSLLRNSECAEAKALAVSYAIEPNTKDVYYSTKQGKILKYNETKEDTLVYDANSSDYLSIPRELSFDGEGNLYFTDIGLRTVSMISADGSLSQVIYEGEVGEELTSKYIYYYMNASNGLIAVTTDYTAFIQDEEIVFNFGSDYSSENVVMIFAVWGTVILMALMALYLLAKLAVLIIKKGPKTFKLAIGVVIGVICIAGVFLLIVLPDFENRLIESLLQRAQVVSDVTGMMLPKEEFKRLDSTSDYMSEDYIAVRNSINEIYLSGSEGIGDFYCVLYTIRDHVITCTYALQEDTGAIYPYDWDYEGSDEQWIFENGEGKVYKGMSTSEGNFLFVLNPISDDNGNTIGLVEVGTDLNSFHKETNNMIIELLLHVIAITIVVVLVALEIIIFMHGRSEYQRRRFNKSAGLTIRIPNELLRILVFGIFFITNMTTSFLPLYALNIAENEIGLSIPKEVLAAIPISAEVLFGAIFSIMGNVVIKRFGQKKSAILGSVLITVGLIVRILVPSIWILTLGNSIMGSGWGILLLIVNTVIAMGDDEEKNQGFAGYSAAALNGINCGIVFGGFLINWLSYTAIFMFTVALSLFVVVHVAVYLTKVSYMPEAVAAGEGIAAPIGFMKFITSKGVLKFFLMIVIPVIACGYFLNFLFPILGFQYGLSETKVGYAFLINGLCVICFSNVLTNYFSKKVKKAYSLVIASLLYALAFLCVAYFQNIYSLIIVLVLLGLSDSFGLPLQTSYYTDLDAVKKYGFDKSMGIYSLFENIAQAGGSFVFSYVLIIGVKEGLNIVLSIVAILAILFGIMCFMYERFNKKKALMIEGQNQVS